MVKTIRGSLQEKRLACGRGLRSVIREHMKDTNEDRLMRVLDTIRMRCADAVTAIDKEVEYLERCKKARKRKK